ncbi:uncharacterized protein LOC142632622 [Castanea sativa]|uniref:uncharacterized protein LOC142632622 n=1 Tax=Castanea sativa TaxID=21020 RepID=UPI003F64D716
MQSWTNNYKEARVHHIVDSTSDHFALLISNSVAYQQPRRRRFHFEVMWTKKEECMDIIEAAWRNSTNQNNPRGMAKILNQCAAELSRWNMSTFGWVPKQIRIKKKAQSDMVVMDRNGSLGGEINQLRKEINDLLDSEEIMWLQRAKVQWLGLGDRNTKYFHSKASEREE